MAQRGRPVGYLYVLRFTRQRGGRWRVEEAVSYVVRRVPRGHRPTPASWHPAGWWASRYSTGPQGRSLRLHEAIRGLRGALYATHGLLTQRFVGCWLDRESLVLCWRLQNEQEVASFSAFVGG